MTGIEQKIAHSKLVTDIFGHWPTFHDAEVLNLSLERDGNAGPQLIATIRASEMTSEVSETGHYIEKNRTFVEIRFAGIKELELFDFNEQNALLRLAIDEVEKSADFKVVFTAAYGLAGAFRCKCIEVASATPAPPPSPPTRSQKEPGGR